MRDRCSDYLELVHSFEEAAVELLVERRGLQVLQLLVVVVADKLLDDVDRDLSVAPSLVHEEELQLDLIRWVQATSVR